MKIRPNSDPTVKLLAVGFAVVGLTVPVSSRSAEPADEHIFFNIVPGHFTLLGKFPENGDVYAGTAEISSETGHFNLVKTIAGKSITAVGTVQQNDDGNVDLIRFSGSGREETCLVQIDLDNFCRLTCYWTVNGTAPNVPGLEAYFPTAPWD
ncbi:MAG: hypothetical protein H6970_03395 [Gammaproteobacteria bacterium]|nr:hypothetical protein [Gammaproteobacteria bacterium]MCP5424100.1 hypothetical protein [Gammaproteobacteria bacterium]MCP5459497.1 hypothetical protein [Gammaproteobacteria bacterium]